MTLADLPKYRVVIVWEGSTDPPMDTEIPDSLNVFQAITLPNNGCVDMPRRYIGTTEYMVIVDDCGAIDERLPMGFGTDPNDPHSWLFGTLIFCQVDDEGESLRSLTDDEVANIYDNLSQVVEDGRIVVSNLRFHPNIYLGLHTDVWDAAAKKNMEMTDYYRFVYRSGGMSLDDLHTAIRDLAGVNE